MSWVRRAALGLLLAVLTPTPAPAAARAYVVATGSTFPGQELAAPEIVLPRGAELIFVNMHLWGHNITSDAWLNDSVRLFRSDFASFGEEKVVERVELLQPGRYGFFCRNHGNMRGSLTII